MSPSIILLLVARGEAGDPTTQGAVRATHELFGQDLQVEVREFDRLPTDEHALELGESINASAIIELSWDSPEHRQARVHFYLEPRRGWNDRVIGFDPGDDPRERGRTIGFAVASMLPGLPPAVAAPPSPSIVGAPEPRDAVSTTPVDIMSTRRWVGSLDAVGATSVGIRGQAPGWGGAVSARWYFAYPVGIRLGVSGRAGEIDPAQATSLHFHLAAGVVWLPIPPTAERRWELGLRIDALALRERLTHYDSDDPAPVAQARWLPGADAAIEGGWMFNPAAGLVGGVATEVAFGHTDVTIHQARVATIPPLRLVVFAGVRASF